MDYDNYLILKKDNLFLEKAAFCCETCYLDITQFCNVAGVQSDNLTHALRKEVKSNKGMFGKKENHKKTKSEDGKKMTSNDNVIDFDLNQLQIVPFKKNKKGFTPTYTNDEIGQEKKKCLTALSLRRKIEKTQSIKSASIQKFRRQCSIIGSSASTLTRNSSTKGKF